MMLSYDEVVRSLYGAYLLARADARGMTHFDLSVDGFWRSFFAAVLALPGYALVVSSEVALAGETDAERPTILARGVVYVAGWIAFPLAALLLCRLLDLGRNYVALIVAINWAGVLQIYVFAAVVLLGLILPGGLAALIHLAVLGALLVYVWFVIRTALQTTGAMALLFLLIDLMLPMIIDTVVG